MPGYGKRSAQWACGGPSGTTFKRTSVRTRRFYDAPLLHLELWWSHEPSHAVARARRRPVRPVLFPVPGAAKVRRNSRRMKRMRSYHGRRPSRPMDRDVSGTARMAQSRVRVGRRHGRCGAAAAPSDLGRRESSPAAKPIACTMTLVRAPVFPHTAMRPTTFTHRAAGCDITRAYVSLLRRVSGVHRRSAASMCPWGLSA